MSKKEQARPRFRCPNCGVIWVYHETICIVCKTRGIPLNDRAERLIRKAQRESETQQMQGLLG